jgi:hypothetical protein
MTSIAMGWSVLRQRYLPVVARFLPHGYIGHMNSTAQVFMQGKVQSDMQGKVQSEGYRELIFAQNNDSPTHAVRFKRPLG